MRNLFGKYWPVIPICIALILCAAVLVQIFKLSNWVANWLFNFVNDWAIILSASITLLLAVAALWAISETRRIRSEDRKLEVKRHALLMVRKWVQKCQELLLLNAQYSDEYRRVDNAMNKTLEKIQDAKMELVIMGEEMLKSAVELGADMFSAVENPFNILTDFINKGMAENPNIDEKHRVDFLVKLNNISTLAREIEGKGLSV